MTDGLFMNGLPRSLSCRGA
uniref:Uncharacterized protein n=1 Tax=Anguilla anguilla TaxID=7936 RepID=A0A0E9UGX8_ANGAN